MGVSTSLLPELENVVQHNSAEKRTETLRRITTLFLDSAATLSDEHVALFDDAISYLIKEVEALAELARRIAPVPNAPENVVRTLAGNDDITVAGPVLKQAKLAEPELMQIAETKSQAHLRALSEWASVSEVLADILVVRGNSDVPRSIATNKQAKLSQSAFTTLARRAAQDATLTEKVGLRTDIPPWLLHQLLLQATDVVQKRMLAQAKSETQTEIRRVLAKVSDEIVAHAAPRSYPTALAGARLVQGAQAD